MVAESWTGNRILVYFDGYVNRVPHGMDVYHRGRSVKEGHRLLAQASVMIIRLMTIVILNCVAS